ncbi:BZ3500_MvSof-1268-A1-R1_Chr2-2g04979 [Microbotryum saponariae]|uniref:BZ3500_MvSof-1268-A1-R1_Chr2-2g04979 protein n=1 Tax=Microbotryum saponariae TaxID=289078 RepID=A0A2X0KWT9_9BASI|nr:BZ3500_MvSof-1268-A1-R1_Chr2-2g04979 [Microbotryum saponariae]
MFFGITSLLSAVNPCHSSFCSIPVDGSATMTPTANALPPVLLPPGIEDRPDLISDVDRAAHEHTAPDVADSGTAVSVARQSESSSSLSGDAAGEKSSYVNEAVEKERRTVEAVNDRGVARREELSSQGADDDVIPALSQVKSRWTIFDPFNRRPVQPPPKTMDDATTLALANANWLSVMTFAWIQPLLVLGYKRELAVTDLPKMDETREAALLADRFLEHFERRKNKVEAWNSALEDGSYTPGRLQNMRWRLWHRMSGFGSPDGKQKIGLAWALSDVFFWEFWSAGLFKVVGDLAQVTSSLVTKQIIHYVTQAHQAAAGVQGVEMPSIGRGVGLAIGLFFMQLVYSVCTAQTFSRGGQVGVLARGALIAATYRRSIVLSGRARQDLNNSKLVSLISADISRIDFASSFFHFSWTCIFQLIEVIVILLVTIGVSSLAGFALVAAAMPLQTFAVRQLFKGRQESMKFTDARIKSISELLIGIKIVKLFNWERPTVDRVHEIRRKELGGIRKLLTIRAANLAIAMSIPTLASIIVFAVYAATGHSQNPAEIWTSLSLLNLLRMPMMLLPNSLSTIADANSALKRVSLLLTPVFTAETLPEAYTVSEESKTALTVKDADFEWESATPPSKNDDKKKKEKEQASPSPTVSPKPADTEKLDPIVEEASAPPSRVHDISFDVPRGQFLCVVGPVGSGKSSLLQGLLGEMRKTRGQVAWGGSVSYCAQTAWAQNQTLRENILFGRPFDETRYWECVRAACLLADFDMLPSGDLTEIGEKGVSLSGGQRQRVSIARTLYFDADIVLLDDPLSAVDAHVGAWLFEQVINGVLKSKTRILVTHALHVLPHADQILVMEQGSIAEKGTYTELLAADGAFARLVRDFGSTEGNSLDQDDATLDEKSDADSDRSNNANGKGAGAAAKPTTGKAMMQIEERMSGGISKSTYREFLRASNGAITAPLLVISLFLMSAMTVLTNLSLTWWQEEKFGQRSQAFYSGLYALLGVLSAIATFAMGVASVVLGTEASISLHRSALNRVVRAPMSFYDTTPLGRILNRLGKDIDSVDNRLNDALRMTLATFAQIGASVIMIAIVFPYFLLPVAVVLAAYVYLSHFYRQSAREIKRHDNILRSSLYSWFSESLAGMSTIRAFGEGERFVHGLEKLIDLENRAYYLTVVNQRWLAIRLDFLGAILTIVVSIVAVARRTSISPASIGLALSVVLAVQQALSMVIRQSAEVENNMASVERLVHYQNSLEQEAAADIPETAPDKSWPQQGQIEFKQVEMAYRPELPPVLHGVSFIIRPGEKVGIVGRTGSGKSSIVMSLFRMVELSSGQIIVDGEDISKLGLDQLRSKLAIIPQEAVLFNGTLRSNLDPFGIYEDQALWDALRRAWLVDQGNILSESRQTSRFTLDTVVEDEGLNMSVGERSLVALARALIRDSRIVVLDEATSSVDIETDQKVQSTIMKEFVDKTLIVIAHRINTIISYDRVLVLDKGTVVAFDTPAALFEAGGIFNRVEGTAWHEAPVFGGQRAMPGYRHSSDRA